MDNFYTGTRENIVHLLKRPNFEFMRHDITFPLYVVTGSRSQILFKPALADDPAQRCPDITLAWAGNRRYRWMRG